jgi:hypothetical protein
VLNQSEQTISLSQKKQSEVILPKVMKQFFSTHLVFGDADLRTYCLKEYGVFSESEYVQALWIATNVFREIHNI